MAFRSLAQLKTQVWDTREQVVRELKANALAEQGPTHRIIEYNGKYQIEDVDPDANQEANDVSEATENSVTTGKKKSAMARIKQAAPAKKKAAAKVEAAPAKKKAATPEPAAEPVPVNDMTPPPNAGGPYHLRLEWAQFSIADGALLVSKAADAVVQIIGGDGKVARVIDGRLARGPKRAARAPREGTGRKVGETNPDSKRGQCTRLLLREKGARAKELEDVIGRKVRERFLERLATRSKATLKKLGEGHWRLIPA